MYCEQIHVVADADLADFLNRTLAGRCIAHGWACVGCQKTRFPSLAPAWLITLRYEPPASGGTHGSHGGQA